MKSWLRLIRPHHWIKNAFILMPIPFALKAGAQLDIGPFLLGLASFSLLSSAVYAFNDLVDAEADRLHPKKRHRPVASGAVSVPAAAACAGLCILTGLGLAWMTRRNSVLAIALVYLACNAVYSLWAKRVAPLDVFLLAVGFLARVLFGCALLSVSPSGWLLLCTFSLALFLGFGKRHGDLALGLDQTHRPSLSGYTRQFLTQAMCIMAATVTVSYALYCIESGMLMPGREMASLPFVVYAVLYYLRLAQREDMAESHVELALKSRVLQVCGAAWAAAVMWSIGMW